MIKKRVLQLGGAVICCSGLGMGLIGSVQADDGEWQPSRHVSMVVPFSPGGGSDIFGRAATTGLKEVTEANISVNNVVGGSGAVGYSSLLQRNGNPNYLLSSETGAAIVLPLLNKVPYSWDKLTPIAEAAEDHTMILVAKDSPYQTIDDLVQAARKNEINIAISGKGSPASIAFKLIEDKKNINFNRVVFESGSANNTALMAGDVAAAGANPGECIQLLEAGKVRALAVFKDERFPEGVLSQVPTIAEAGIDVDVTPTLQFRGLLAAPGLSRAQKNYWENAVEQWSNTKGYKKYVASNYLTAQVRTGDEFADFLKKQQKTIAPLVKEMK